jgi:hypothetical protein
MTRFVLLDALQALGPHLDAVVLLGAQAVYLHTGDTEAIVVPTTTDADLALFPVKLMDEPLLKTPFELLGSSWLPTPERGAGASASQSISWSRGTQPQKQSAFCATSHPRGPSSATYRLEPALVDNDAHVIVSFEAADPQKVRLRVAGACRCQHSLAELR